MIYVCIIRAFISDVHGPGTCRLQALRLSQFSLEINRSRRSPSHSRAKVDRFAHHFSPLFRPRLVAVEERMTRCAQAISIPSDRNCRHENGYLGGMAGLARDK